MEFDFICTKALNCDKEGFAILEGNRLLLDSNPLKNQVNLIIDNMGYASSKAQKLNNIITTSGKFFSSDHRLYLKASENKVIGLLKIGHKKLFIRNEHSLLIEIFPLCVLDFYVHESQQRNGVGKALFEKMLASEDIQPHKLGYDRPSEKFINFLAKHYNLKTYIPQNNNFVVYDKYFDNRPQTKKIERSSTVDKNERKISSAGQYIIDNPVNRNYNNQYKFQSIVAPTNINLPSINYLSETGDMKKLPYINNNPSKLFNDKIDNKSLANNYFNHNKNTLLNQSNLYHRNNIQYQPQEYKNTFNSMTNRPQNISMNSVFNQENEVNNIINTFNQLDITNKNNDNNNYYKKRNDYATIFDDQKLKNNYNHIYERSIKSKNEKSNIFF